MTNSKQTKAEVLAALVAEGMADTPEEVLADLRTGPAAGVPGEAVWWLSRRDRRASPVPRGRADGHKVPRRVANRRSLDESLVLLP